MKLKSLAVALIFAGAASQSAFAAETNVALHGMVKSGTNWITNDGLRRGVHGIGINDEGYFHAFCNESVHKIQINPSVTYTADDGVYARAEIIFSHENYDNDDWGVNGKAGGGMRRGVVYLGGFDFNPSTEFWAGKTKDAAGSLWTGSYDTGYIEDYGVGGGFQNMDIGFAKWDLNVISFDDEDLVVNSSAPEDSKKTGTPTVTAFTTWMHGIAGTGLDYYFRYVNVEKKWTNDAADDGFQTALVYNTPGYFWFGDGFGKIVLQYGKDAGATPKIAGAWYGVDKGREFTRLAFDGAWNVSKDFSLLTMLFLQHDHRNTDKARDFIAASVRPVYQLTPHFSLQGEIAYEHANYSGSNHDEKYGNYDFIKLSFAPTLSLGQGIWGAPSIQPYVSFFKWNKRAALDGLVGANHGTKSALTNSSDPTEPTTDVWTVGVQAVAYF